MPGVRKEKVYLCLEFQQDLLTRIKTRRVWYSLTIQSFPKFLEEFAYWDSSDKNNPYRWGKRIPNAPYFRGVRQDENKISVVTNDEDNDKTHIFYSQEWDTASFLEIVSKFHPSLRERLIDDNFVLNNE